jgi:GT2 family glycosyltransferase
VIDASGIRTPGFARNRGARLATREWLVFIDADTRPAHSVLDAYFDPLPGCSTAILAGGIVDVVERQTLVARYTAKRSRMSERTTLERTGTPYAQTANCAVRRSAFAAVTGFDEQARAGEDADLCFRLAAAGWQLEHRPSAIVTHRARETAGAMVRQLAVHGSGAAWLNRRHPGSFPPPQLGELGRRLARDAVNAAATALSGEGTQAADAMLDLLAGLAFESGRLLPNARGGLLPHAD